MRSRPVLLDLVTAAALLWLSVSDDWVAIVVTAALVASRAVTVHGRALRGARSHTPSAAVHGTPPGRAGL